jgi:hypothetical protein
MQWGSIIVNCHHGCQKNQFDLDAKRPAEITSPPCEILPIMGVLLLHNGKKSMPPCSTKCRHSPSAFGNYSKNGQSFARGWEVYPTHESRTLAVTILTSKKDVEKCIWLIGYWAKENHRV